MFTHNIETMENAQRNISFSPPDITEAEIAAVADALRSGWITTGPRTKELEQKLCSYTGAAGLACLNSATAALECALRILGIGPGDEVIVPAYTYTASASIVVHVGATLVLVDVAPNSFHVDPSAIKAAITPRTKAVIPVDIAGAMADYRAIISAVDSCANLFVPSNEIQEAIGRPALVADAAHSLGAWSAEGPAGSVADFTAFSFHAVKNFTTAEGGALAWRNFGFDAQEIYRQVMLWSLHGQTKDAMHKSGAGNWEYDIAFPGYKWNMTDIQAAMGLAQFDRYPQKLARRQQLVERYEDNLASAPVRLLQHFTDTSASSAHLMLARIQGATEEVRNAIIVQMGDAGVATNVHYKPLPLLSAYRNLGFNMADYPNAHAQYENEITLPLHTLLSDADIDYVCQSLLSAIETCC